MDDTRGDAPPDPAPSRLPERRAVAAVSALSGRAVRRGDDGGGGRRPECRCEACSATRPVPLPRAAVLASRVVLGVLSGAAAVVITLGW